jgi:hypothetical protein
MFDNLNANIVEATDADIDSAFGEADDKKGAKSEKKTERKKPSSDESKSSKKNTSKSTEKPLLDTKKVDPINDFSDDDEDVFTSDDDDDADDDKSKKEKGKDSKTKTPLDTVEDEDDENPDEDEDQDKDNDEDSDDDEDKENEGSDDVKTFLKARVDLLIKKGEWADFEGSEDFEWDEDSFADMEIQQRTYQRQQMREELLESFGPYGKEIADYAAKGGDPDKLIDIFKEQQVVESLSIENEDGQRAVVMKYETEFLNKKPERVRKYIDSLVADKELAAVAAEAKQAMEDSLEGERETLKAEQQEAVKRREAQQKQTMQKFQSDVSALISKSDDIPADEKRQILQVLTKFDKKLKNGSPVNEFYFKFEQFRKDLPNYIKLVRFVMNPDKFIKSIENTGKSQANEKAFKMAMGANKSKKVKAAGTDTSGSNKPVKTTFKLM